MSNQANIELLESIFEEVQEAFPFYDEEKQIEIANNRFWDLAQWNSKTPTGTQLLLALAIRDGGPKRSGLTTHGNISPWLKSKSLF